MYPPRFISTNEYIQFCEGNNTLIAGYNSIISALQAQALSLALNPNPVTELFVNDGQTIIKGVYLTPQTIGNSIMTMIRLRNIAMNEGNRVTRLIGNENFNG